MWTSLHLPLSFSRKWNVRFHVFCFSWKDRFSLMVLHLTLNLSFLSPSHTATLGSKEEQSSGESLNLSCALCAVFRSFHNFGLFRGKQYSFKWHWYNALLHCRDFFHQHFTAHCYSRVIGFPHKTSCASIWSSCKVSFLNFRLLNLNTQHLLNADIFFLLLHVVQKVNSQRPTLC